MALLKLSHYGFRGICTYNGFFNLRCMATSRSFSSGSYLLRNFYSSKISRFSLSVNYHRGAVRLSTWSLRRGPQVSYLWNPNLKVFDTCLLKPFSCKFFHTTPCHKAIPPALWVVLRPVVNVAAILFGRLFRKFWQRLPQEKRDKILFRLRRHKRKLYGFMGALSVGLLLYMLVHIEEVPQTKRRRFILFSQQDMRLLSDQVQNELLETYEQAYLPHTHPLYRRVVKVMTQLMNANREDILKSGVTSWKIFVIDDPEINNAMVLPNGSVFIFSGIMDTCSSDDQLGAVLAHEIAHVLLNHQGETFSKEHFFTLLSVFIITAIWAALPDFAAFLSHVFASQTTALFIHLPFSRLMETEADTVGLILAAKACLDVREASVFWAKMALREELGCEEKPFELLSSHPSHETRQKAIDELIPDVLKLRESCKCRALSSTDPRVQFSAHRDYLKEAQIKGCLSCQAIFSRYSV